jgi:hypothetical protein
MEGEGEEEEDGKDELMLHPPELSKWEREDYEWDLSPHPVKKSTKASDKITSMLPRYIQFYNVLWKFTKAV